MAVEIIMPKAGMAMEEGKIIRWLKEVGDPVEMGEAIMEIETDKITMESESPAAGILLAKFYEDGDVVPVTLTIGYVGEANEKVPEPPEKAASSPETPAPPVPEAPAALNTAPAIPKTGGPVLATPYAKTLAAQSGVDLGAVIGSAPGGVIKARDVKKASPLAARMAQERGIDLETVRGSGFGGKVRREDLAGVPATVDLAAPLGGMRAVIARRMSRSHREIPAVTQTMKAYVDDLLALRAQINEGREDKVTLNDLIIKATAKVVAGSELFRTEIDEASGQLITRARTNIAIAVALNEGLMVPVIYDADKLPLTEISRQAKDLAARARRGGLGPDEQTGHVFTISNIGPAGIFTFTPIINQPNAAILGVGSIHEELALADGAVQSRKFVMLCLTFDHRIIDGAAAAEFQGQIKALLEKPVGILI